MNALDFLKGWIQTAVSYVTQPPVPTKASIVELIMSRTCNYGPSPRTGGVIHKIDQATAEAVADEILAAHAQYPTVPVALIVAGLDQEGRFDPNASNPNWQDKVNNPETELEAFEHEDVGIAQIDGSTLIGYPELHGKSIAEMRAWAFDIKNAIPKFVSIYADNIKHANDFFTSPLSSYKQQAKIYVPNGNPLVLAIEAYNAGWTGAANLVKQAKGDEQSWKYGLGIYQVYQHYESVLSG